MAKKPKGLIQQLATSIGGLFRKQGMNYDSTRFSPSRGRVMHTAPSDLKNEMTSGDHREIVRLMRALDKNNAFVNAFTNAHLTYSVGDGFRYQPLTSNPEWNKAAKAEIELFNIKPTVDGRYNWLQVLRMTTKALLIDGDIFFLKTRHSDGRPAIQPIEAHRIANPEGNTNQDGWNCGIKFDKVGRPIAYCIKGDDGKDDIKNANAIIHVYDPDRFTGVRGISKINVSANSIRDRSEILAAEKLAVKEFSRRTFVLKSDSGEFDSQDAGILGNSVPRGSNGSQTTADDVATAFGGLAMAVKPNESLEAFEHNRPSMNVLGFADVLDRETAVATGLGSDFLLNPTKIGGAVVRMELAKSERQFGVMQRILIDGLEKPVKQFVLADRITAGVLPAQEGWEKMTFNTPRRLSVDVGRDTLATIRELEAGTKNLQDIIEELGEDAEAHVISRLDFKAWATEQAKARGMTYDDVSLTSILSKPAETPAPVVDSTTTDNPNDMTAADSANPSN